MYSYTWQILRVRGLGPVLLRGLYGLQECVLCSNKLENISVQTLIALLFSFSRKKNREVGSFLYSVQYSVYLCCEFYNFINRSLSVVSYSVQTVCTGTLSPNKNWNGKWAFFSPISLHPKRLKESFKNAAFSFKLFFLWDSFAQKSRRKNRYFSGNVSVQYWNYDINFF